MDVSILWTLRKPVVWVWRKLVNLVGAWTVVPIYRQSHDYHVALRRWQQRWEELSAGIDYKLHLHSSFGADRHDEQSIWIRNSGNLIVDEIHFCVEARRGSFCYQAPLAAYRIKPASTTCLVLTGLPLQDLFVYEDAVFSTYESVHVYPVRIVRNGHIEFYSSEGLGSHPTHSDYLNGEWKRWNGRLYNLTAIKELHRTIHLRLAYSLCWRHGLISSDILDLSRQAIRQRRYWLMPGLLVFALASSTPVLIAIAWIRLLLRMDRISFTCDEAMAAATNHVQRKGKSARPSRIVPY